MDTKQECFARLMGTWRVCQIGQLTRDDSGALKFYVYLSPFDTKAKKSVANLPPDSQLEVLMPAAELPLIHFNSLIVDGVTIQPRKTDAPFREKEATLRLNTNRNNFAIYERSAPEADGEPSMIPISKHTTPHNPTFFAVFDDDRQMHAVIIPCVEIFRCFLGRSNTLINTLLSNDIFEPDRYIWDKDRSIAVTPNTQHAHLHLRKWQYSADVSMLAWLYNDPYALEAAQAPYAWIAADTGSRWGLRAYPPFQGTVELEVKYVRLPSDRMLVTRTCLP